MNYGKIFVGVIAFITEHMLRVSPFDQTWCERTIGDFARCQNHFEWVAECFRAQVDLR